MRLRERNEEVAAKHQELATRNQELVAYREEINTRRQEIESQRRQLAALQPKDRLKLLIVCTPFCLLSCSMNCYAQDGVKLEDSLSCDICAHLMYSPYT